MIPARGEPRREFVVVPHRPGPLLPLDIEHGRRGRDDLDDLIDDLFPDVDDRAGWFDAVLLGVGAVLLGWAARGDPPPFVVVVGFLSVGIGCVLPLRAGWRRAQRRRWRRRREAMLAKGVPVDVSSPSTSRLVRAYEDLIELEDIDPNGVDTDVVAAAHGAVLEVASLLEGRSPGDGREAQYVEKRATAIEALAVALREPQGETPAGFEAGTLVEAREELDQVAGLSSISRLEELTEDVRIRRRGPA